MDIQVLQIIDIVMRWIYQILKPFQFARCEEAYRDVKKFNKPIDLSNEKGIIRHFLSISIMIICVVPASIVNGFFNIKVRGIYVMLTLAVIGFLLSFALCDHLEKQHYFEKVIRVYNIYIKDTEGMYTKRSFALLLIFSYSAIPFIIMMLSFQISRYFNL